MEDEWRFWHTFDWTLGGNIGVKILNTDEIHWFLVAFLMEFGEYLFTHFNRQKACIDQNPWKKTDVWDLIRPQSFSHNMCFRWSKFQLQVRLKQPFQFPGVQSRGSTPTASFQFFGSWWLSPRHPIFWGLKLVKSPLFFGRNVYFGKTFQTRYWLHSHLWRF